MRRAARLVSLVLATGLAAGPAAAHEILRTIHDGTASVVELSNADGSPFSYESFEVYRPGETVAFQVGRTDRLGRIVFVPDRAGSWRVRAFAEDGHGADFVFHAAATGTGAVAVRDAGTPLGRASRIVAGVGIVLGLFGAWSLFGRRQSMNRRPLLSMCIVLAAAAAAGPSFAHHGVASLGVAGLEGPGAPIETSNSATIPARKALFYSKLDYADFETFTPARDDESSANAFWMYGVGYGVTPYLTTFLFLPFTVKAAEDNSFNTAGFADISLNAVIGFKLDRGLHLIPASESLDDLEDWHFSTYGGLSLPTGDPNIANADGAIDPGMSLGFGLPSFNIGASGTRMLSARTTWCLDTSWTRFLEYEYDDGTRLRFGSEYRASSALAVRLLAHAEPSLRLDANLEVAYLGLGRDEIAGGGEEATGGRMLYVMPGTRLFLGPTSLAVGVKVPTWTDLNEESEQQAPRAPRTTA